MIKCERFRVSGRVQGVGFRAAACSQARRLGLAGWVRNLADGRVELLAQGEAARLDSLFAWLQRGPPAAGVTGIERSSEPCCDLPVGFNIR